MPVVVVVTTVVVVVVASVVVGVVGGSGHSPHVNRSRMSHSPLLNRSFPSRRSTPRREFPTITQSSAGSPALGSPVYHSPSAVTHSAPAKIPFAGSNRPATHRGLPSPVSNESISDSFASLSITASDARSIIPAHAAAASAYASLGVDT